MFTLDETGAAPVAARDETGAPRSAANGRTGAPSVMADDETEAPPLVADDAAPPIRWSRLRLALGILTVAAFCFWLGVRLGPLITAGAGDGLSTGTWLPTPAPPMAYIGGAVRRPGLYPLAPNGRLAALLREAGGPACGADLAHVALAAPVHDGDTMTIPSRHGQRCRG